MTSYIYKLFSKVQSPKSNVQRPKSNVQSPTSNVQRPMSNVHYEIELPDNHWVSLPQRYFRRATDGAEVPQETLVRLRRDGGMLTVEFECLADPFWRQNSYREHNDSLWKQEVFELFIAAGETTPTRYLELEINPNNALFVGQVHNPDGEGKAIKVRMIPHDEAGIDHSITHTTASSWRGEMHVPFALVGEKSTAYRINFYRIVLLEPQDDAQWVCTPENSSFQCWSPTLSGDTPRFHRPAQFGTLRLL